MLVPGNEKTVASYVHYNMTAGFYSCDIFITKYSTTPITLPIYK